MEEITTTEEIAQLRREIHIFSAAAKWEVINSGDPIDEDSLVSALDRLKPFIDKSDLCNRSTSYNTISIEEKFAINYLQNDAREDVGRAMCYYNVVDEFITHEDRINPGFHRRVANFFIALYNDLRRQGCLGDELYQVMMLWFKRHINRVSLEPTASALVAYLFAKCDIFEKTEEEKRTSANSAEVAA